MRTWDRVLSFPLRTHCSLSQVWVLRLRKEHGVQQVCVRCAALGVHLWGHLQGLDLPLVAGQGNLFHSLPPHTSWEFSLLR